MNNLIDQIITLEYKQFSSVQNRDGRSDCQDDFTTFEIMRKSQFEMWNENLLHSYLQDLVHAEATGWNLPMEKYARMMESTAYEEYLQLKDALPLRSQQRLLKQEELIKEIMYWYEQLKVIYPLVVATGRPLYTYQDTLEVTSTETYLRGELTTYSDETFNLYYEQFHGCTSLEESIPYKDVLAMAKLYGYTSLEELENSLKRR
ncbi:MAG: DUF4125 family protein [Erysipelotrichaceae bacterium]|nr:DUF4125 family protein [Erysipelotrichaceae bacterium]